MTSTTLLSVTTPSSLSSTDAAKRNRKKPKKKKKKKKKRLLRHQQPTSTTTLIPETSPLTTTDTLTTPQWRLIVERLFGPYWQENAHEELENAAKMRINPKPRVMSLLWQLVGQNKDIPKTTNAEQKLLLSDASAKDNTQLLGMKTINPHPLYIQDSREFTPVTGKDLTCLLFFSLYCYIRKKSAYFDCFINVQAN